MLRRRSRVVRFRATGIITSPGRANHREPIMHFTIDGRRYSVVIAQNPPLLDGLPCRAKIDHGRQKILLSPELARHERRRELFHELRHAWVAARGRAADDESDAAQAAEMMDVLMQQYL